MVTVNATGDGTEIVITIRLKIEVAAAGAGVSQALAPEPEQPGRQYDVSRDVVPELEKRSKPKPAPGAFSTARCTTDSRNTRWIMQSKMMLRLLKEDKKSPSGYRIVGYARISPDKGGIRIEHGDIGKPETWCEVAPYMVDDYQDWIRHDAIERGIKVGDEWWFEGDIFDDYEYEGVVSLVYTHYSFRLEYMDGRDSILPHWHKLRLIGNIHTRTEGDVVDKTHSDYERKHR